jgi:acetyl esterase
MSMQRLIVSLLKNLPNGLVKSLAGQPLVIDGNTLDPNIQILAKLAPPPQQQSIQEMRAAVAASFKNLNAARRKSVHVVDTSFKGPASDLPIRIYEPDGIEPDAPAILFFHQGGLVLMDLDSCDTFCSIMAEECGAKVISLDYRLCPEHEFPAAIEDAFALWDYVQDNAAGLSIDPTRVGLAGDSAGGLITANVAIKMRGERRKIRPRAQLLIYPWVTTDLEDQPSLISCAECFPLNSATMELFNNLVFPNEKNLKSPLANPLKARSLKNLPPAIVATAGFDPIRDQGNAFAARLAAEGNTVSHHCFTSLSHSFVALGNVSKAAEAASIQLAKELRGLLRG